MMHQKLSDNLASIKQRVGEAAIRSGRTADDVTLVAVTKYVDVETTRMLVEAGQLVLGESRPQVLWQKAQEMDQCNVDWHMIGHLQRNKVDRTLPLCKLIHSVDSPRLMKEIDKVAEKNGSICSCLLEVNISGEPTKYGFQPGELEQVLVEAAGFTNIKIRGLMGMASLSGDAEANRKEFADLRQMRERLVSFKTDNIEMSELSMGMSGDFEAAIEEGATIVRIGSVLFDGVR